MATQNQTRNNEFTSDTKLSANLYYALLIATFSLLFIGIIMILSASTTVSYKQFDNQYVITRKKYDHDNVRKYTI